MFYRSTIEALRRGERRIKKMNDSAHRLPLLKSAQGTEKLSKVTDWDFYKAIFHRELNFPKCLKIDPYVFSTT